MKRHQDTIWDEIKRVSLFPVAVGLIILFVIFAMSGCTQGHEETFYPSAVTFTPFSTTPSPTSISSITHQSLSSSSGPYLLIQSDITQYQIINFSTKNEAPFDAPNPENQYRLSRLQSPSGQLIFFSMESNSIWITDLTTGEVLETHDLSNSVPEFNTDLAIDELQSFLVENQYSHDSLKAMIEDAYQKSLNDIRWYKNDQNLLLSRGSSPTSTNLTSYDRQSKFFTYLEDQPGLVLDYQVGPGGNLILLKKGFINEPFLWESIQYYILDVNTQKTEAIVLPEIIDNPTLFWLQNDTIGVIHQMAPLGGIDFSIIDLNSGETTQIIKGAFTHIGFYNGNIFWIKESQNEEMTTVGFSNLEAETLRQQTISQRCSYKTRMNYLIFLNCKSESLALNENLDVTPFGSKISLLVPSPQSEDSILVTQDENVFLLNQDTLERKPLNLEGRPLEIRWLPDGSGFLYRIPEKLLIYEQGRGESSLLLESQILGDYTNINAVWIRVK